MASTSLFGQPITVSVNATLARECLVRRTWRDRLLSWPWRPWVKTRWETRREPAMFKTTFGWLVHPAVWHELQRVMEGPATPHQARVMHDLKTNSRWP